MMNYSDYDSDGYSSNEDADYVPSGDDLSEEDINQCEKEDPLHEEDDVPHPDPGKKEAKKKKNLVSSVRKKKKKAAVQVEEEKSEDQAGESKPAHKDDEASQKKKADDLWALFLSDVGSRPKACSAGSPSCSTAQEVPSGEKASPLGKEAKATEPAKVTITKVFDFAGEEIRVKKEVSADSREAQMFLKNQGAGQEENPTLSPQQPSLPGPSAKRPAGMSGILSHIGGKKSKMSTLEKSKMDWDAFKSEEGITEELAIHNRGREGYVERKNFLERVDHRQFELEKAVRLSNMKR
ncbi:craniofacial development protein 1 [Takifugu rubripes]|uniref:craniofacial development protein 1 n=1 Tax=Takifugu rubripes TaxID=31033 RepID=UPI0011455879|nr:craniofacial development protein 1 [Takifugu rubripes]XP_056908651.1 craniofacial development protein 1 isoform X1 [Takifugu flavidus]